MKYLVILLFFSSISLLAQESESNHHLFLKYDIGCGYSIWRTETSIDNYKGSGPNFSFCLTPYYNYKKLIIGLGYGYEKLWIDTFINTTNRFPFGSKLINNHATFNKYTFTVGSQFIQRTKMSVITMVNFGKFRLDKSFSRELIKYRWVAGIDLEFCYKIGKRSSIFFQTGIEYKFYGPDKDLLDGLKVKNIITSFNGRLGINLKIF